MSFNYPKTEPVVSETLLDTFGKYVELFTEEGEAAAFEIVLEFTWGDFVYVAIQSDDMKQEDEVEFLRVVSQSEEIELESLEDDEWEAVSEVYDDLAFQSDERP